MVVRVYDHLLNLPVPTNELKKQYDVVEDEYEEHIDDTPEKIVIDIQGSVKALLSYDYSQVRWERVLKYSLMHIFSIHCAWKIVTFQLYWKTIFALLIIGNFGGIGMTMGAHRYWSHRSFKANSFVRHLLILASLQGFYKSVYDFVIYHKGHHRFVDTLGDHVTTSRGLFYAHIGNLLIKDHPKVTEGISKFDFTDIEADKLVMFEHRHYFKLLFIFNFLIPVAIPMYFWDESFYNSFICLFWLKTTIITHMGMTTASMSHTFGRRPYDKNHRAGDNFLLAFMMLGEGWHNFHHVFPFDYRAAEFAWQWNPTAFIIDFFAKIGFITDRRIASPSLIRARMERTGDGAVKHD